jgi:photosynthetic reaction center cytochrome c subunit
MITLPMRIGLGLAAVAGLALLLTFERPPVIEVQRGYRGTGMVQDFNPRLIAYELARNKLPSTLPPLHAGPPASAVYKNVKVLGDLDVGAFTRLMASITTWVAPKQGCSYCHSLNNMASDDLYTKVVARRMIQMVRHINGDWKSHVQTVGVTCYTCHRGQPVPANIFYHNPGIARFVGMAETQTGKNLPNIAAGYTDLPYDPFTPFLEQANNIRVEGHAALAGGNPSSIKQTEWTYALMMHFSQSLGVNCTYCHSTRQFADWTQSSPQRVTAWYGIRMLRDLNNNYLDPLHTVFPVARLGPEGDSPKADCATCHQGVYKPLFGVSPLVGFPERANSTAAPAVVPAAAGGGQP